VSGFSHGGSCDTLGLEAAIVERRGLGYTAPCAAVPLHHLQSVIPLGQIGVMGTTHEMDIIRAVVAATAIGIAMMELEAVALIAAATVVIHIGATSSIAFANGAFNRRRNST
jgi:hypothetical protein